MTNASHDDDHRDREIGLARAISWAASQWATWQRSWGHEPRAGPLLNVARCFANCCVWHWLFNLCVAYKPACFRPFVGDWRKNPDRPSTAAIEWYWVVWALSLAAAYLIYWCVSRDAPSCQGSRSVSATALAWLFGTLSAWKVGEIVAVLVGTNILTPRKPAEPQHALLTTFIAYVQVAEL